MRKEYISYEKNLPILISYVSIKEYPLHWHNSIEIIYVLKGNLNITIDTDNFELTENELEIINVEETHSIYSNDENNKVLIFQIDPTFFEKYYKDIKNMFFYTNSSDDRAQEGEEYEELRKLLSRILCEFIQKQEDFNKEIESNLINLLYHLLNHFHYLIYEKEELKENSEQLERYHRISKYIYNNYNNNITLQEIAKKEFLSPHYLSHEIKSATGYTFTDLINLTRVEESLKLLLDTDMSISEISDEIGFSHIRYFNKNFKFYYNCTPFQYRKKYKIDDKTLEKLKDVDYYPVKESLNLVIRHLEDYERFNYENKLWKIHINMNDSIGEFNENFREIIGLGEAFDLLIEDNKDILEEIQEEIHFNYGRLENFFHPDMGIFPKNNFFNWNKINSVLEFLNYIELKPLIVIDDYEIFSSSDFKNILKSFYEYFSLSDIIDLKDFQFQFSSKIDKNIKLYLSKTIEEKYNFHIIEKSFTSKKILNKIYDTAYMLPYIIHNYIWNENELDFLNAFDVLGKQVFLTNEVFIGASGIVNDVGIKKPSYYAYYLLSKMSGDIVAKENGYIVTKKNNSYSILLYSYNDHIMDLIDIDDISIKRGLKKPVQKKFSLNISNINSSTRSITYEINEKIGSSFNYWIAMGKPNRLNKEEKEILYKASFPKIEFKYTKNSSILNIVTKLKGYGAILILINEVL
ncbi:AraC family transcriptional regulator [Clostridium weizhouense]|uniref:Helix-turn-helix domain-containing protein n=1 Tax=Clostridium weizhouense TaxID=2859781 RepID=A0ABS7AJ07_9CLOT|nr:helix-turn-helix domain-containing protein [Clostridium weizhouense]MBW6408648.1 helix-turn-helix domain-containing protein [Clostridium weizhouense]